MSGLNCDDIRRTLSGGTALLDVRAMNEFDSASLPGAIIEVKILASVEFTDVTIIGGISH